MTGTALARNAPGMTFGAIDLGALEKLATLYAESGFFTDSRQVAQAAVKVLAGVELGFGPTQSMQGVYIVKGRVTLSANLIGAAIKRHPKYDYRIRTHTPDVCAIEFFQGDESLGTSEFTMDMAKRAGLAGGDNWRKYPEAMLFARALTAGARFMVPDVFGAPIYTPDEIDGGLPVDPDTGEVLAVSEPSKPRRGRPPKDKAPEPEARPALAAVESPAEPEPVEDAKHGPEPEAPASASDPESPATPAQLDSLRGFLARKDGAASFIGMGLISLDVPDSELERLTSGQAAKLIDRTRERYGDE